MKFRLAIYLLGCCALCRSQAAQPLAFDVASVKPDKFNGVAGRVGIFVEGTTLHAELIHLNRLVAYAYDIEEFQLSGGPSWALNGGVLSPDLFQIVAKPAPGENPSPEQFRMMLQTLLADRFHLQIHHTNRQLPVYNLVVNKGGSNLRESAGGKTAVKQRSVGDVGWSIDATNATIQDAVPLLSIYGHRPVFDKTGLTSHYDFTLKWLLKDLGAVDAPGSDLPALPAALQEQLGLKLESTTAPYDTVVIDHAEKPTEN